MAAPLQSIVAATFTDTGTGPFTTSSYGGRQTLATAFGTSDPGAGNRPYLFIWNQDAGSEEWAVVTAHMTSATALVVDSTIASSTGSAISWSAGTKYVSNDIPPQYQLDLSATRTANTVLAGPSSGSPAAPAFRALVSDDIPALDVAKITTGIFAAARGGTNNGFTQISGPATSAKTFTLPNSSQALACIDLEDQTITGGGRITSKGAGTVTSGTTTLDPGDRPMQDYTNGGAHTLAPGSNNGSFLIDITNNGSAGAITTSGWTKVSGSPFTTTNGHKFRCAASIGAAGSLLVVQALQ